MGKKEHSKTTNAPYVTNISKNQRCLHTSKINSNREVELETTRNVIKKTVQLLFTEQVYKKLTFKNLK